MKALGAAGLACGLAIAVLTGIILVSCGQAPGLDSASEGNRLDAGGGGGVSCGTPNDGCPCSSPGEVVECGKVVHRGPGGYVACSMGHRTCAAGTWGTCVGETDVTAQSLTKHLVAGGGLQLQSLGANQVCPDAGPYSNPCDPYYCNYYLDTPEGGIDGGGAVVLNDAGAITINPEGGIVTGGGFSAPQSGQSACSPTSRNVVGTGDCTGSPITNCQQDFRCDPTTKTCLWNGNTAYYDPTVAGVDLTVEAPCGPSGSANTNAVVCNRGSGTLAAGSAITFFVTNGASPPNACTNLGAPTQTNTLSSALTKGMCTSFTLPNSTGAKFVTVNAGVPGSLLTPPAVAESAGYCGNNSAYSRTDGSGGCGACNTCVTTLTGTIYDPRGVNPLPDVTVYVPTDPVSPLPVGVACDTCTSLISGTPWSLATTDYKGQFTITVPDSYNFPLIIQAGRWRRRLIVSGIPSCTTVSLDAFCQTNTCQQYNASTSAFTACSGSGATPIGQTSGGNPTCSRLPGQTSEGDLPTMALVQAGGDQLECLMRKIGVADSEFTAAGGTGKVRLFSHNGWTLPAAAGETAESALWGNAATGANPTFNNYGAIISPCDNNHTSYASGVNPMTPPSNNTSQAPAATATAPQQANMKSYLDAGGRLFATHWFSYDWVAANYPAVATYQFGTNVDNDREAPSFDFTIDTSTTTGSTYSQWLNLLGASPGGVGTVRFLSWRHLPTTVNMPSTLRLAYGDSSQPPVSHAQNSSLWGGPLVSLYQFDTPYGSANPCGRVELAMSHVSQYLSSGNMSTAFPGGCPSASTAMTAQELAFEFLIFNSQACLGLVPTVPPPQPTGLPTVTFTRDYQAVCPAQTKVKWGVFYWEATIPGASSIAFRAATANTQALLPASPGTPPTATSRSIGNATTTVASPAWSCDGCPGAPVTVDYHLQNDVPTPDSLSQDWLRVFMTFTPDNSTNPASSPTLNAWRQTYDCVASE
jgi:hypothetical protein